MPIKVEKQGKESTQNLARRFTQKLRKSGTLLEARKRRFKKRPKSAQLKKRSALRRIKKKTEALKKQKMDKTTYSLKKR